MNVPYIPTISYLPKQITNHAISTYLFALLAVNLLFFHHALQWYWWFLGISMVFIFFYYSNILTRTWAWCGPKAFERRLFVSALLIRVAFVGFFLWYNQKMMGDFFGYDNADPTFYADVAQRGSECLRAGNWNLMGMMHDSYGLGTNTKHALQFSDSGFPLYLSIVYFLTGDSIPLARLINCIWSAWTVLLIYRLAKRNFGEGVGRMAAIMCMLQPNLWYYCGTGLKETLMVFLTILFVERADAIMRTGRFTIGPTLGLISIAFYLFMVRTPLAATLVLGLMVTLLLTSSRVIGWGKRIALFGISLLFIFTMLWNNASVHSDVSELAQVGASGQKGNMEWRSNRINGNKFARKAGAAVFAPLIFTIPFPTMTETPGQEIQRMAHAGNFTKNIMSFFTILSLVVLLLSGRWRDHVLPLSIFCGYLVILTFSSFAQSERFHQPILCFTYMFAAYGVSLFYTVPKYKRWFNFWLVLMFVAAIGWNWFKLAGRGMV